MLGQKRSSPKRSCGLLLLTRLSASLCLMPRPPPPYPPLRPPPPVPRAFCRCLASPASVSSPEEETGNAKIGAASIVPPEPLSRRENGKACGSIGGGVIQKTTGGVTTATSWPWRSSCPKPVSVLTPNILLCHYCWAASWRSAGTSGSVDTFFRLESAGDTHVHEANGLFSNRVCVQGTMCRQAGTAKRKG